MENTRRSIHDSRHLRVTEPSPWVLRFAPLVPAGGTVLDLACGGGRHARHFLDLGHRVVALDRDIGPVADLDGRAELVEADLEDGGPWPLAGRTFAAVVVVNYLHRPLFGPLLDAVEAGGVFIYETFARGNERFTRPRNPSHLLNDGELLEVTRGRLRTVAYEHGVVESGPLPGVIQRICAVNDQSDQPRPVHPATKEEPR